MNFYNQKNILHEKDILFIKKKINDIIKERNITELKIKDNIFNLLESVSKVLYYPIDDKVSSFYMKINENSFNERFVFINTNMPYERQVFAAAHELSHILSISKDHQEVFTNEAISHVQDVNPSETEINEQLANRFASELLVCDNILEKELSLMNMDKMDSLTLKGIVKLMDEFLFPYKEFVIKLHNLGKLSNMKYKEFISIDAYNTQGPIIQLQQNMGLCTINNRVTKIKKFSNFIDLTIEAYNKTVRTYDKLEYLLRLFDLEPKNLNVKKKKPAYLTKKEFESERIFEE